MEPAAADAVHADGATARRARARVPDVSRSVGGLAHLRAGCARPAVGAFDLPARQALVPTLVPREHLPNAISLNTIMFQAASVAGPSIGGLLIAAASVGWVYVVNALSFGFVIVALLLMRDLPERAGAWARSGRQPAGARRACRARPETDEVSWHAALEGLRFVFRSPLIRSTMLLDFFATFFSSATALLPIFAQDILRVGARGYGWLYAAPAVGALVTSAAMVPLTDRIERRGPTLLWAVAGYGLATLVFGLSRWFWLTFACLALTGATDTVSMVIRNIVRQLETPDRLRGRMTGVNMVFFMGGPQLGELEAGVGGELVRRALFGRQRRRGLSGRDGVGRRLDARAPALRARPRGLTGMSYDRGHGPSRARRGPCRTVAPRARSDPGSFQVEPQEHFSGWGDWQTALRRARPEHLGVRRDCRARSGKGPTRCWRR